MTAAALRRACLGAAGIVAVFGAAQLAMWADRVNPAVFPLPSTVLSSTVDMVSNSAFWASVAATLGIWVEAMAISVAIAVPLGLLLGSLPWAEQAVRPVIEFLRPIPSVVLIPLVLLIVQDNAKTQVVVIVFAAVWPILINTVYGLSEVDPLAKQTLRTFGFGPVAVAWRVSLPSAAPFIGTGVRIAASVAFVVAVAAELIGAGMSGIGSYLTQVATSGTEGLTPILAVAAWSGALGLVINGVFVGAERRVFRWHHMLAAQGSGA
ncbi:MAG: ABC transporter permease subunit [Streptosporangiaceae bacterium]|jgi:NitT/TauT family transport system permease protein